ncbi:hypothetical protein AB837_00021 [bacterium AB1]|nr:hypothetical protein AB837_00021 [bacterium AB1]
MFNNKIYKEIIKYLEYMKKIGQIESNILLDEKNIDPYLKIIIFSFCNMFEKSEIQRKNIFNDVYSHILSKIYMSVFLYKPSYLILSLKTSLSQFFHFLNIGYSFNIIDSDQQLNNYYVIKETYLHDLYITESSYILASYINETNCQSNSFIKINYDFYIYQQKNSYIHYLDLFITQTKNFNEILWSLQCSSKNIYAYINNKFTHIGYIELKSDIDCIQTHVENSLLSNVQSLFLLNNYSMYIRCYFYDKHILQKLQSNELYINAQNNVMSFNFLSNNIVILSNLTKIYSDSFMSKNSLINTLTYQNKKDYYFASLINVIATNINTNKKTFIINSCGYLPDSYNVNKVFLANLIHQNELCYLSLSVKEENTQEIYKFNNYNNNVLNNNQNTDNSIESQIFDYSIYVYAHAFKVIYKMYINNIYDIDGLFSNYEILLGATDVIKCTINHDIPNHYLFYINNLDLINDSNILHNVSHIIWIISYYCKNEIHITTYINNIFIEKTYDNIMFNSKNQNNIISNIVVYLCKIYVNVSQINKIPKSIVCMIIKLFNNSLHMNCYVKYIFYDKNNNKIYEHFETSTSNY